MSVATMADHAGQVIIADVMAVRSYWTGQPRRIETEVSLSGVRFLKGAHEGATDRMQLIVPGGTIGTLQMRLCCAPEFAVGQRRILFLLPTYKTFPTVGLDQGAFDIISDADGVERVYQMGRAPVVGLDADGMVQTLGARPRHAHWPAREANNLRLKPAADDSNPRAAVAEVDPAKRAMALDDFLAVLEPILKASRDHQMNEPAGKRVPADLRAVPLKASPRQDALRAGHEGTQKRRSAEVLRPSADIVRESSTAEESGKSANDAVTPGESGGARSEGGR